jgi:hypothetical protein
MNVVEGVLGSQRVLMAILGLVCKSMVVVTKRHV